MSGHPGLARRLRSIARKTPVEFAVALAWQLRLAWRALLRRAGIVADVQWARVVMDRETDALVDALAPLRLDVLEISGDRWARRRASKSYRSVGYPGFDACRDVLRERFDLIIAEQVWEHLPAPHLATRNAHAMLVDGGHLLLTTPFLIRVHEEPEDHSRWTRAGLQQLLVDAGFDARSVVTGAWGNRACVVANFEAWAPYNRLLHSLRNEPSFPVVVWAMARRT